MDKKYGIQQILGIFSNIIYVFSASNKNMNYNNKQHNIKVI